MRVYARRNKGTVPNGTIEVARSTSAAIPDRAANIVNAKPRLAFASTVTARAVRPRSAVESSVHPAIHPAIRAATISAAVCVRQPTITAVFVLRNTTVPAIKSAVRATVSNRGIRRSSRIAQRNP